jgi:quercetin dioxygenase-like cupin family protein
MSNIVVRKALWGVLIVGLVASARVWATVASGLTSQILATGFTDGIAQHIQFNKNPDGSKSPWGLQLQMHGDTEYRQVRLVLAPGGHSGWHRHPGLLVGTVKSGQVDSYDSACQKRTIKTQDVFSESDETHAIINTGSVDAELYLTFLVKRGVLPRLDSPAPECWPETGIP